MRTLLLTVILLTPAIQTPVLHDKTWWKAVAAADYAVPEGAVVADLVRELSGYLGSPDPELRDDIAYSTLTQWIYVTRVVPADTTRALMAEWTANLSRGIGESGTDAVFRRSFSALMLATIAGLDNAAPFLDRAEFDRLLDAGLSYLSDERDVRGFDATKGWMHSVAHTADLLKFLARSRHLTPAGQRAMLTAIAAKVSAVDHVLTHGEDERLARAVLSIVAREDADLAAFDAFLAALRPAPPAGPVTPASLAVGQNRRHLAVSLFALLGVDEREGAGVTGARERLRVFLVR